VLGVIVIAGVLLTFLTPSELTSIPYVLGVGLLLGGGITLIGGLPGIVALRRRTRNARLIDKLGLAAAVVAVAPPLLLGIFFTFGVIEPDSAQAAANAELTFVAGSMIAGIVQLIAALLWLAMLIWSIADRRIDRPAGARQSAEPRAASTEAREPVAAAGAAQRAGQ
jgi:fumarate reductase subunit D